MNQNKRDELNEIQKMRGRRVTHEEAAASAQRLINSHFHNPDSARVSIPADPSDDDLIVTDYIAEQSAENQRMRELLARIKKGIADCELDPSDIAKLIEAFLAEK